MRHKCPNCGNAWYSPKPRKKSPREVLGIRAVNVLRNHDVRTVGAVRRALVSPDGYEAGCHILEWTNVGPKVASVIFEFVNRANRRRAPDDEPLPDLL